jgi:single-stranded-DNA-specific exonuclease
MINISLNTSLREQDKVSEPNLDSSLHPIILSALQQRGLSDPLMRREFLEPSLDRALAGKSLKGLSPLLRALRQASIRREKIAILCDYDADGATSAAIFKHLCDALKIPSQVIGANRYQGGYGLKKQMIDRARRARAKIIIALDIGSSDHKVISDARKSGLRVFVVDHHELKEGAGKPCPSFINPHQKGCDFEADNLCTAGLSLVAAVELKKMLAQYRFKRDKESAQRINLTKIKQLSALGTVADQVPLKGLNRAIVKEGLSAMNSKPEPWALALRATSDIRDEITSTDLAFQFAPRLNATGRLMRSCEKTGVEFAVETLLASQAKKVQKMASWLGAVNLQRRAIERKCLANALSIIDKEGLKKDPVLVLASDSFHLGVLGIVASRLVERFERPVILLGPSGDKNTLTGSGRTVPAVHMKNLLSKASEFALSFGGHAGAGGVKIANDDLLRLRKTLCLAVKDFASAPTIYQSYDLETTIKELRLGDFYRDLSRLEPTGRDNPPLRLLLRSAEIVQQHSGEKGQTILYLRQGTSFLPAIIFQQSAIEQLPNDAPLEIIATPIKAPLQFRRGEHEYVLKILRATQIF